VEPERRLVVRLDAEREAAVACRPQVSQRVQEQCSPEAAPAVEQATGDPPDGPPVAASLGVAAGQLPVGCRAMPSRILLLGDGDIAEETAEALRAAGADVTRFADPSHEELRDALSAGADAAMVVSNDDAWPLRAALLVRHLDRDVPIVATIFNPQTGRELEELIGNCTITSVADIAAPTLAGPCLSDELCTVLDGDRPVGLRCREGEVEVAALPEVRVRRVRAVATAIATPFDRSAALVFFGAIGLLVVLVGETLAAALVLEQELVDAFYGAVKTLVTVDPNPQVQKGPGWFKVAISLSMLVALLFAAAFTGGLVERLIGRRLTGMVGRRAVPRSDHVVVVGLGQVGLRLAMLLRQCGVPVVAVDDREDGENVGHARERGLPVVIGRGADPSLLDRLSLDRAIALAAVTNDDLQNINVTLAARAVAPDLRLVLRAGSNATAGETRSLEPLGHVRDVHRIGAVYLAGLALGSAATHVVLDGGTAHLRDDGGALERCPYPIAR
jgi:Trk K+ transport system NAD-binding subunit